MDSDEKRLISNKELFTVVEELLNEDYQAQFTVTGNSMWPLMVHGRDYVVVEKCLPTSLRKGDIILFHATDQKYMLHRITSLKADSFETTGDGNCFRDGYFPKQAVIARVVKVIRKGKVIELSSFRWKIFSQIWMALFPMRRGIFRLWHIFKS